MAQPTRRAVLSGEASPLAKLLHDIYYEGTSKAGRELRGRKIEARFR